MSNEIDEQLEELEDAHDELEGRLRKVEVNNAALHSTIKSMSSDLAELKLMFQRFFADSVKITELSAKIDAIPKIKGDLKEISDKYRDMHDRFIILEHSHTICNTNREKEQIWMKDIGDKISKIDGERLTKIEQAIQDMKTDRSKMSGFWGEIVKSVAIIIVIYALYLIAIHVQPTDNPVSNPPALKDKSKIEMLAPAQAHAAFKNNSTH